MSENGGFLTELPLQEALDHGANWVNKLAQLCHRANLHWWKDPATGILKNRNRAEMLFLMVTELAEAGEGERKDLMDTHLPHRKMAEVELADCIIRLLDYAAGLGYDVGGALIEKTYYNAKRADHTRAARLAANGKKF